MHTAPDGPPIWPMAAAPEDTQTGPLFLATGSLIMLCLNDQANTPINRSVQVLRALPQPLLVLRRDRLLLFCNFAAERICHEGLAVQRAQHLMQLGQLEAAAIEQQLHQAARGVTARAALWFRPGLQTGWLQVAPLSSEMARATEWPTECLLLTLQIDQPDLSHGARIEALCRECRLSNAERYVLMLLADGMAVEAVARQLGVQISTLRTHVRHLLDKTQASSLMQLLRWLGSATPLPH